MTGQENAGATARLKPVAYARKQAGETVFLHTAGVFPDDGGMSALVLQSDALAQIAALEAEIARLREAIMAINGLIMGNSDQVAMFCGIHSTCVEALKGSAA